MEVSRSAALVLALLAVLAPAIGVIGPGAAAPSGMITVDEGQITEDLPGYYDGDLRAADLHGSLASQHAESLEIVVTTPKLAMQTGKYDEANAISGSDVALILRDDTNHAGRKVALPVEAVHTALDRIPERVYGVHESGEQWSSDVSVVDGYVTFRVPQFSSNVVTFQGEYSLQAQPASNGSTYQYDIDDLDAADNFTVQVEGSPATEWDNESAAGVSASGSSSVAIAGDSVTGPGGSPSLTVSADFNDLPAKNHEYGGGCPDYITVIGNNAQYSSDSTVPTPQDTIYGLKMDFETHESVQGDIYVQKGGSADTDPTDGRKIADGHWFGSSSETFVFDQPMDVSNVSNIVLGIDHQSGSNGARFCADDSGSGTVVRHEDGSNTYSPNTAVAVYPVASIEGLSASGDQGSSASLGDLGPDNSITKDINVSPSTSSISFSASTDGSFDYTLKLQEQSQTADPVVEVNGNTTSYSGTLSDGQTASLSVDKSWLQEGTNRVNVTVGDGSLSADAPTPEVGLTYSHGLTDQQFVTYASERWTDRYDISRTYASSRDQSELSIPFESDIFAIRGVEARVNGTTWETVADSDYTLSGNDLAVDLGAVYGGPIPATTEIEVRANGSKVKPHNVSLTVLNATDMGSTLDSKIRIDSAGTNAYIAVGNTSEGSRLHYAYDESWSGASDYAVVEADGSQHLHLPNAEGGDTAQVTYVNTEVSLKSGDVRVAVESGGALPTFDVSPGPGGEDGSDVTFTHYDTVSGNEYILYSTTNGIVQDSATASSPVLLTDDDSDEVLEIREDDGNTSSGDGGSGSSQPPVIGQFQTEDGGLNVPLIILSLGVVLLLVALVQWRTGVNPLASTASGAQNAASKLAQRPRALAVLLLLGLAMAVFMGVVVVTESVLIILSVAGIAVLSFIALRRTDNFTMRRYGAILGATVVTVLLVTGELSAVFNSLGRFKWVVVAGGLYLAYQGVKAIRQPDSVNKILVRGE